MQAGRKKKAPVDRVFDARLGAHIASGREQRGISRSGLAEKLAITVRHLYSYETGRCAVPLRLIKPICEAFGVTVAEFLSSVPNSE